MIIHRFWAGEPEPAHVWTGHAVKSVLGGVVRDWTSQTLPAELRWATELEDPRDAANRLRYMLLHRFGGLWLDMDILPLHPFPDGPWTAAIGERREGCALYFPEPGNPMMAEMVAATGPDLEVSTSVESSGAGLLNAVGQAYKGVALEPRILPFDSVGNRIVSVREPIAVHLWATTSKTVQ